MWKNVLICIGILFLPELEKWQPELEKIKKYKKACHFDVAQPTKLKFSWIKQNKPQNWKTMFYKTELEKWPCKVEKIQIYDIFKINSSLLIFSKNWPNTIKKPCWWHFFNSTNDFFNSANLFIFQYKLAICDQTVTASELKFSGFF